MANGRRSTLSATVESEQLEQLTKRNLSRKSD